MKYIWCRKNGDEMHGLFDSIAEAVRDAREYADDGEPLAIEVFDTRPATGEDAALFDASETVDTNEPDWCEGCYVPCDIVHRELLAPLPEASA